MSLRDLDDRWLPEAAARARAWVDRLGRLRRRGAATVGALDLERLDERWARGPLLRGLQRRPAVGLLLSVLLLAAGLVAAVNREGTHAPAALQPVPTDVVPSYDASRSGTLGPVAGAAVQGYVRTATEGLVRAVQTSPNAPRVALVSLASYLTPEGAQLVLNGVTTSRVFVRAPAAGRNATPFTVDVHGDVLKALRVAYADTAKTRSAAATSYQKYVDTLAGTSPEDKTFRDLYSTFARVAAIEAAQYAGDCACVYAALVVASPATLVSVRARPGVRVVEVAPAGDTTGQVQVQPLRPDVVGTVPRPNGGGGS